MKILIALFDLNDTLAYEYHRYAKDGYYDQFADALELKFSDELGGQKLERIEDSENQIHRFSPTKRLLTDLKEKLTNQGYNYDGSEDLQKRFSTIKKELDKDYDPLKIGVKPMNGYRELIDSFQGNEDYKIIPAIVTNADRNITEGFLQNLNEELNLQESPFAGYFCREGFNIGQAFQGHQQKLPKKKDSAEPFKFAIDSLTNLRVKSNGQIPEIEVLIVGDDMPHILGAYDLYKSNRSNRDAFAPKSFTGIIVGDEAQQGNMEMASTIREQLFRQSYNLFGKVGNPMTGFSARTATGLGQVATFIEGKYSGVDKENDDTACPALPLPNKQEAEQELSFTR